MGSTLMNSYYHFGLKKKFPWILEFGTSLPFCAYYNAKKDAKSGRGERKEPVYLTKKDFEQKLRLQIKDTHIDFAGSHADFLTLEHVAYKGSLNLRDGLVGSVCITKDSLGRCWLSYRARYFNTELHPKQGRCVGIDLGIKHLATFSDGGIVERVGLGLREDPSYRRLAAIVKRKRRGSKNKRKAWKRLRKYIEKVRNKRLDFLHKLSLSLVRDYDVICLESLNAAEMIKTAKTSKMASQIRDSSFGTLRHFVLYKGVLHGKAICLVGKYYPSSQLCHCCGYRNPKVKNLAVRDWKCPRCGQKHDRDLNAAINILTEGYAIIKQIEANSSKRRPKSEKKTNCFLANPAFRLKLF